MSIDARLQQSGMVRVVAPLTSDLIQPVSKGNEEEHDPLQRATRVAYAD